MAFDIREFLTEQEITPGARILLGEADWTVSVDYPGEYYFDERGERIEQEVGKIARKHKAKESGKGMGFGIRDMSYYGFKNKAAADKFAKAAKKVEGVKNVVSYDLDA